MTKQQIPEGKSDKRFGLLDLVVILHKEVFYYRNYWPSFFANSIYILGTNTHNSPIMHDATDLLQV